MLLLLACASAPVGRYSAVGDIVDGQLWVIGGASSVSEPLSDTWSLDLGTLEWTRHDDAPEPVYRATASLAGSKLWIFGGDTGEALSDHFFEFDPASGAYTDLGRDPIARYKAASVYANDTFYLLGGYGESVLADGWAYAGGEWTQLPMPVGYYRQSLTLLDDGSIYMFGGIDEVERSDALYRFTGDSLPPVDFEDGPGARASHCAWGGGALRAWGGDGSDVDLWTFDGAAWTSLALDPAPPPRDAAVCAREGDKLYVFGGDLFGDGLPDFGADLWVFDGSAWTELLGPDGLVP